MGRFGVNNVEESLNIIMIITCSIDHVLRVGLTCKAWARWRHVKEDWAIKICGETRQKVVSGNYVYCITGYLRK